MAKHRLNSTSSFLRTWNTAPSSSLKRVSMTSRGSLETEIPSSMISSPVRPANIEASLSNRDTESPSLPHMEDLLLSPRATEFTQNPFALAMGEAAESPQPAHALESDPRSPAQKGGSPITRNILDAL